MQVTRKLLDELTYDILGCAIEVHKSLGPGLLETTYERCFVRELSLKNIMYQTQIRVPIDYKGEQLDADLRLDVLVEDLLIVELKAVDGLLPIHEAVLLTYMRLLAKPKGLLINFNCLNIFKTGQKTLVNSMYGLLP
jgi:GxxExxY protein